MLDDLSDSGDCDFARVGEDEAAAAGCFGDSGKQAATGERGVSAEEVFEEVGDAVVVEVDGESADG